MVDVIRGCEALVRSVARAFYNDECVVVLDALVTDKYLREDEMRRRVKMSEKQARGCLQFLESERLISSETLAITVTTTTSSKAHDQEGPDASSNKKRSRPKATTSQVTHWYVDYGDFVAVVRFRLHAMRERVKLKERSATATVAYECPVCGTRYSEHEAFNVGFVCNQRLCERENRELKEIKLGDSELIKARSIAAKIDAQLGADLTLGLRHKGIFDLIRALAGHRLPANRPSENRAAGMGGWSRREAALLEQEQEHKDKGALFAGASSRSSPPDGDNAAKNGRSHHANSLAAFDGVSSALFLRNAQGQEVVVEFFDDDDDDDVEAREERLLALSTPSQSAALPKPVLRHMPSHLRDDRGVAASLQGLVDERAVRGALFDDSGPETNDKLLRDDDDDDDDDDDVAWEDADAG